MYRRRLDALQQVSLAAATVLEPRQLARVALQETIDILGAERAFLFLIDADTGHLVPHLGRDAAGTDLEELTGYGASLVTRVRTTGEPLVVTGGDDGAAHGSRSALVHGLRSILVAPLRLKGRLQGVVYLDSRVAKGIFTHEDADILMAITNHVAVSLETARAAQLEVAVEAARGQRDLAELLRSSMAAVSTTLDPDEVLRRLLDVTSRALPGDAACLLRHHGDGYDVVAVSGNAPPAGDRAGRPTPHCRPATISPHRSWARSPTGIRHHCRRCSPIPGPGSPYRWPPGARRSGCCWWPRPPGTPIPTRTCRSPPRSSATA